MSDNAPLLEVEDLSIMIGRQAENLVDGVSFSVMPGETLCIVGESGCGKSVTALALMGLLQTPPVSVTGGRVRFDGRDLLGLSAEAWSALRGDRMAMIFQEPMTALNPAFTIGDQIIESVMRHRDIGIDAARARALDMLERVGIPAARTRLDAYPHQLSGGMRQRAMIAMALACRPGLVIADEPTTALDVTIQAQILDLLNSLQKTYGMSTLLITHDLGVVAQTTRQVAVMYAGLIVERARTTDLFEQPLHPYTTGLFKSIPRLGARAARLDAIPGQVPNPAAIPPGCAFHPRCTHAMAECRHSQPKLSEHRPGHWAACHWLDSSSSNREGAS